MQDSRSKTGVARGLIWYCCVSFHTKEEEIYLAVVFRRVTANAIVRILRNIYIRFQAEVSTTSNVYDCSVFLLATPVSMIRTMIS
jgi:hypothetical protein